MEWLKLAASFLTPLTIALLTYVASRALNERASQLRKGEQLLGEKQRAYAAIGEDLNVIFVFVRDVGDFRRYTPDQIIDRKRSADRHFYMYRPYWSDETEARYKAFVAAAFRTFTASGSNAKIRTLAFEKRKAYEIDGRAWDEAWTGCLTEERDGRIDFHYQTLVAAMLDDVITLTLSGRAPQAR